MTIERALLYADQVRNPGFRSVRVLAELIAVIADVCTDDSQAAAAVRQMQTWGIWPGLAHARDFLTRTLNPPRVPTPAEYLATLQESFRRNGFDTADALTALAYLPALTDFHEREAWRQLSELGWESRYDLLISAHRLLADRCERTPGLQGALAPELIFTNLRYTMIRLYVSDLDMEPFTVATTGPERTNR